AVAVLCRMKVLEQQINHMKIASDAIKEFTAAVENLSGSALLLEKIRVFNGGSGQVELVFENVAQLLHRVRLHAMGIVLVLDLIQLEEHEREVLIVLLFKITGILAEPLRRSIKIALELSQPRDDAATELALVCLYAAKFFQQCVIDFLCRLQNGFLAQ